MAEAKSFQCPNCGSSVTTTGAEKEVKCAYCGSTVIVPQELRDQAAPFQFNYPQTSTFDAAQSSQIGDEVLQTVGTVGKVAAGVTVGVTAISVILPIALTCIILGAVGAILYFVFSTVNSAKGIVEVPAIAAQPSDTAIPPTAAPTPFDTPIPYSTVLIKDNFTKTSSGWDTTHSANYTLEYKGGKYHILISKQGFGQAVWLDRSYTDVSVEADAQETAGPNDGLLGVSCRAGKKGGMYTFEYDQNGDYGIYKYDTSGNATSLDETSLNPNTVNHGGINHIQGFCVGTTLTLVLNGQPLLQVQDSDYTVGGVGLIVREGSSGTAGIDTLFSSFLVSGP
jgi:DNA-directed RNA polymerase subunit RPC12/RpoP